MECLNKRQFSRLYSPTEITFLKHPSAGKNNVFL